MDEDEPFDLSPEDEEFGGVDDWAFAAAPAALLKEVRPEVPDDIPEEWAEDEESGPPVVPVVENEVFKTPLPRTLKPASPDKKPIISPAGWRGSENSDSEVEDGLCLQKPKKQKRDTKRCWGGARASKEEEENCMERTVRDRLLKLPPKETDSVTITLNDGSRFYLEVKEKPSPDEFELTTTVQNNDHFTAVDALRAQAAKMQALHKIDDEIEYEDSRREKTLWVDKYTARRFVDLLSDEDVNRQVLRAIKMWDPFVFKRAAPRPPELPAWKKRKKLMNSQEHIVFPAGKARSTNESHDTRPEANKRLILLCGPPGTGKSTLARVIARAAGYRSIEINASDERTAAALQTRIVAAQTNRSITCGELSTEPPLLILDEIDGADGKSAVDALIGLATASLPKRKANKSSSQSEDDGEFLGTDDAEIDDTDDEHESKRQKSLAQEKASTKKTKIPTNNFSSAFFAANSSSSSGPSTPAPATTTKQKSGLKRARPTKSETTKRKQHALTRPIICICNDAYATHMRSLREAAIVFHIKTGPRSARMISRLKEIGHREGLGELSNASLRVLLDSAQGDIRSCIHALEFAARKLLHKSKSAKSNELKSHRFALGTAVVNAAKTAVLKDRAADDLDLCRRAFYRKPRSMNDISHSEQFAVLPEHEQEMSLEQAESTSHNRPQQASSLERQVLLDILNEAAAVDAPHLVSSIHENYLQAGKEAALRKTVAMADTLSCLDGAFLGQCIHNGKYELAKFAAAMSSSAAFVYCRADQPVAVKPPKAGIVAYRDQEKSRAAFTSIEHARLAFRNFACVGPRSQPRSGLTPIALDYAPALVRLVNNPQVRPVTAEVLRPQEQHCLDTLADTMSANGIMFERDQYDGSFGNPTWHLRPSIDQAVSFADATIPQSIAPVTRLILNRLVSLAALRAKDSAKQKDATTTQTQTRQKSVASRSNLIIPLAASHSVPPPPLPPGVVLPKALLAKISENKSKRRPPAGQPPAPHDATENVPPPLDDGETSTAARNNNEPPPPPAKKAKLDFFAPRRPVKAAPPPAKSSSSS